MNRTIGWIVAALLFAATSSCSSDTARDAPHQIAGRTMGTNFSIQIVGLGPQESRTGLETDVLNRLQALNERVSTYLSDSELSRINAMRSEDWLPVSSPLCSVLADAQSMSALTGGAFDVTLGQLVNLWGFGPAPSRTEPPPAPDVVAALKSSGYSNLEVDCAHPAVRKQDADLLIDLSAYAKGYAVDELDAMLRARGAENYLVEIGGELRVSGHNPRGEPWGIAVERPGASGRAVQTVMRIVSPAAVATSGDYRNYFDHGGTRYSHTIDPATGWPVSHNAASVTVIADSAAEADALATALLVLGPDLGLALAEREGIAALFLLRDGDALREIRSTHFEDRIEIGR